MITQPRQAPFSLVLAQLGRMIAAAYGIQARPHCSPPLHDPVFLRDFATLTPDQAQELRYGKGRAG